MANGIVISGGYKNITASGNCSPIPCTVIGFLCATTTSGTLTFYDDAGTGTGTPITGTITPAAGSFTPLYLATTKGLNVVVGGTINATIVYAA